MRASINGGRVEVDLIRNRHDVIKVVRLALAAQLTDIVIDSLGEDRTMRVSIAPQHGNFAMAQIAGLFAVVAEIDGNTPEQALAYFREQTEFDGFKETLGREANSNAS